jgi:hypothetical protein
MRFRSVTRHLVGGVIVAALVMPSGATGAIVGPKDIGLEQADTGSTCTPSCTWVNTKLPDGVGQVRVPFDGAILEWRVNVGSGDGPLQLQVLRRTVNKPGNTSDKYDVVRQSEPETFASVGVPIEHDTNLRVKKNDFIGLAHPEGSDTGVWRSDGAGTELAFNPLPDLGEIVKPFDVERQYRLFNATVIH